MTTSDLNTLQTPAYVYDMALFRNTIEAAREAAAKYPGFSIHFAMKANPDKVLLSVVAANGLGADCVSGGEVNRAIECGIAPEKIVYAGVGKTDSEIRDAINAGILCFNVESIEELPIIDAIACEAKRKVDVALRINPDIDAHTHSFITTGLPDNKFGIPHQNLIEAVDYLQSSCPNLNLIGLHFHIGSQILTNEPFELLCKRINKLVKQLEDERRVKVSYINVGGGLGIDYDDPKQNPMPDFKAYFDTFGRNLELQPGTTVHFELGRSLVAQCGSLFTKVLYIKNTPTKQFVIVDAGMNNLIRPALYQAHHNVEVARRADSSADVKTYDIVGPICESTDTFRTDIKLPVLQRGDIIEICSAGAYGESMQSNYNLRPEANKVYMNI